MPKTQSKKTSSFEQSLHRLETIVNMLEKGDVPLEESMTLYEEGIQRSRQCLEILSKAELKLKRLSKDAKGNFALFDEELE